VCETVMRDIRVTGSPDFEIRLGSTPSSGYVWSVQMHSGELRPLENKVEQARERQAGNPVTQVFRFHAPAKGNYMVRFVLKRAWESQPLEAQEYNIEVE
jgi:predicted secreted protein